MLDEMFWMIGQESGVRQNNVFRYIVYILCYIFYRYILHMSCLDDVGLSNLM